MENILVFATSVESRMGVSVLAPALDRLAGKGKWNFDLEDRDRILRVRGVGRARRVTWLLKAAGYQCAELGDELPQEAWTEDNRLAS